MRLLTRLGSRRRSRARDARPSWALAVALAPALVTPPDSLDFALRRAAFEEASGRTWGVIAQLEAIESSGRAASRGERGARASFLLGHAYRDAGGFEEFRRVAAGRAAGAGGDTGGGGGARAWAAWLGARAALDAADAGEVDAIARVSRDAADPNARAGARAIAPADSTPQTYRHDALVRAADAMDARRFEDAHASYAAAEASWLAERERLASALERRDFDLLWRAWEDGAVAGEGLALDAAPLDAQGETLARAARDLRANAAPAPVALARGGLPASPAAFVPAPAPGDWRAVRALARVGAQCAFERDRALEKVAREEERLASLHRYYEFGARNARAEAAKLEERGFRLAVLERRTGAIAADLDSVRAKATRRLTARARLTLERAEAQDAWIGALRHFHVLGPGRERASAMPPGVPSPDSVTRAEQSLAGAVRTFAERMATSAPDLIARSDRAAWRPALLDRVRAQSADAKLQLARARALAVAADSAARAQSTSAVLEAARREARTLAARADSMATREKALRAEVAERALTRAIHELDGAREAIDYGLASAAYAASLRGALADTSARTVVRRAGESADAAAATAASTSDAGADAGAEAPAAARFRAEAIARSDAFLARHAASGARSAIRFQLADLLLVDARERFRASMAAFLAAQESGRAGAALPVLDHGRALALYRAILADDPGFAHADAVRFNSGSILAEEGDPAAEKNFRELVTLHPDSPLAAEASLRLGDLCFASGRGAESIAAYARAAHDGDADVRLVALYKTGWAEFDRGRYVAAADAFRAVLDLYAGGELPPGTVDVRKETEAFLIHTFARAGGADAFAAYFDRAGDRPYAPRLLMAMGQHFRRFERYAEAARADSLHLERRPLDAEALVSAERLTATYGRADRSERSLAARERLAPRFAPGSAWANAQGSDSVRSAGTAFARASWGALALHHQKTAARDGARAEWQKALEHTRTLLERFPDDAEAPAFALNAGEASAALGDDRAALDYYARAAKDGRDSIPELALRQRLALVDQVYERARGTAPLGDEALAKDVLAAGDELLARFPSHARATEVRWREGHLAFAHGWYERSARDFETLAASDPASRRAPGALGMRAEALFRLERYEDAGVAFEKTRVAAERAGEDSLARRAARALPVCAFRRAEASVKADSSDHAAHARLFAEVADRWPAYEHAPLARYRAGLAWRRAKKPLESVAAMEALLLAHPKSELARDAQLGVAETWKEAGDSVRAADAYVAFARRFPKDEGAGEAELTAADLYAGAGQVERADTLRLAYVRAHPADTATGMTVYEDLARRELARSGGTSGRHLSEYVKRATAHPELASKAILAEVRFREAEALRPAYESAKLTLPLAKSIAAKRQKLDALIAAYKKSVELGVAAWAQASAFRIGEALVGFGTALDQSERPAALQGDDRRAYDEVLAKESQTFYDRGEGVWADLLAHAPHAADAPRGEWLERSEKELWGRLGRRFLFKAEVDYPLVAGKGPSAPVPSTALGADTGEGTARAEARP